jgi:hypothetical protein
VLDLANRFADGRLSTQKLANATDEELSEMLIAVRGIGKVRSSPTDDASSKSAKSLVDGRHVRYLLPSAPRHSTDR